MHPYLIELEADYRRQHLAEQVRASGRPIRARRSSAERRWHHLGRRHAA